ncbi:RT0821/Lpp0805 family surface protein [Pseudokordiimonas caeni]|uniref:RT0821/Lpp0805 family surface protein n=1 Tax=Pseudokordiimonas caeni TaxID=2997908 RepID=UPI0028122FF3|nr:RT0821/Lpp0805 family surface protein [Pseudokordiimonas caeni]
MKTNFPCGILACCLALGACGSVSKTEAGTGIGAVSGGVIGKAIGGGTFGLIAGAVAGGLLGHEIGERMDKRDREKARLAMQQSLESGRTGSVSHWRNPDTGHYGMVVPGEAYTQNGQPCRPYREAVTIDGKATEVEGTACRRDDGVWVVSNGR